MTRALLPVGLVFLSACGDVPDTNEIETQTGFSFVDVTESSGLDAVTISGTLPPTQILEVKGGGLALIDFDNDGDRDVFVPSGATLDDPANGPGARLFRNDGDLHFTDVTEGAGIDDGRWSFGVTVGDVDGDGLDDLFVARFGHDLLLRNLGDGRFEDVTEASGLDGDGWSTGAAFVDLDHDGDLDLAVTRYLVFDPANPPPPTQVRGFTTLNGPRGLEPLSDLIYENVSEPGGAPKFKQYVGAGAFGELEPSYGLNLVAADFTGDGLVDLFVGNDSRANHFYRNEGDGLRFTECAMATGLATNMDGHAQATMGLAVADVNGDGLPDLFSSNFSSDTNTLHVSSPSGVFLDQTRAAGIGAPSRAQLGWAAGFYDFDNDGDEDLLVFNGHVYPQATLESFGSAWEQPALLMERVGDRFVPVKDTGPLAIPRRSRSAVFDDLDGDGDIDIIATELNGPIRVFENRCNTDDFITVDLNNAIGATLHFESLTTPWKATRYATAGGPFQSNTTPLIHVGLPKDVTKIQLTIQWPNGQTQTKQIAPNTHHIPKRGGAGTLHGDHS